MTVQLTEKRKHDIKNLCMEILHTSEPSIRTVAKLLGKFTSSTAAVMFGPVHYRCLERSKILALKTTKGNCDGVCLLSEDARSEIRWWHVA